MMKLRLKNDNMAQKCKIIQDGSRYHVYLNTCDCWLSEEEMEELRDEVAEALRKEDWTPFGCER